MFEGLVLLNVLILSMVDGQDIYNCPYDVSPQS